MTSGKDTAADGCADAANGDDVPWHIAEDQLAVGPQRLGASSLGEVWRYVARGTSRSLLHDAADHHDPLQRRGELARPDGRRMPVAVETIPWTGSAQALEAMLRETKVAPRQNLRPPILRYGILIAIRHRPGRARSG